MYRLLLNVNMLLLLSMVIMMTMVIIIMIIIIIIGLWSGRSATWDVTVVHTLAASYVAQSAVQAGKAAEIAAERKSAKYSGLSSSHIFIPVAVESLGTWPIGGRRSSFYYRDWQKNDFQHRGSSRNGVLVPTHFSGDSTIQRRVSCKHFHFRSVIFIPDIIIFIIIIIVVIIIIIK